MPPLKPGTWVKRLTNSTTNRPIRPGMLGRVGGLRPNDWNNPTVFDGYGYVPVQWKNGLWSSMDPFDWGESWELAPVAVKAAPKKKAPAKKGKGKITFVPPSEVARNILTRRVAPSKGR